MKLSVVLRSEPVGGYSVSVRELPGCHSEGETLKEALVNIAEAIDLWYSVAAVREGLDSMDRGEGMTLAQFDKAMRRKLQFLRKRARR